MKSHWLTTSSTQRLLLFFGGWGTDPHPFQHLTHTTSYDVVMLYDYRDPTLPNDVIDRLEAYDKVNVVAWSLGVAIAARACAQHYHSIDSLIAINGTPTPIHPEHGIDPLVFDATIEQLPHGGLVRFNRRMCGNRNTLRRYEKVAPHRKTTELLEELICLRQTLAEVPMKQPAAFDTAIVTTHDRIIPAPNQETCWNEHGVPVIRRDGPHFPFFHFATWQEVLDAPNH